MSNKFITLATVTDKGKRHWSITVEVDKCADQQVACFRVWPAMRVNSRIQPIGSARCIVEESNKAKLDDFRIDHKYQNKGIGSKLLTEIEKWAVSTSIKYLYGDLLRIDSDRFPMLRHLYTKHHWTWHLFGKGDRRPNSDSKIAGIVKKIISLENL